jgi:hypothetical protein
MKSLGSSTVDAVLQNHSFLMVDSNAFIFHYHPLVQKKLQEISRQDIPILLKPYFSLVCQFYEEWDRILKRYSNLYVSNDVLDLELSGHFFLDHQKRKHYEWKYSSSSIPSGSILRKYDTSEVQAYKKKVLVHLNQRRVNPQIKETKPLLRRTLYDYFEEYLRKKAEKGNSQGSSSSSSSSPLPKGILSRVDRDLIVQTFVFALLFLEKSPSQKMAFLSRDFLLARAFEEFQLFLQQESVQASVPQTFSEDFQRLAHFPYDLYHWKRPEKRPLLILYPLSFKDKHSF